MFPTSQQTIGPFFPAQFFGPADHDLTRVSAEAAPTRCGETILLRGRVTRQGGLPCVNAVLELWQADAAGRFAGDADSDPDFLFWGRARTDADGRYAFRTVLPGCFADQLGPRAPHANITLLGSGLMRRVLTTVFLDASAAELSGDPVLSMVPSDRRPLLLADPAGEEEGLRVFRFDIRLRGTDETPFFAV